MEKLKENAHKGVALNFITNSSAQIFQFVLGIILARLLSPSDYGLTGMVLIFLVLSDVFIDSGFGTAIIRKKNPTPEDYSTVFWFNFLVSLIFYGVLFFSAPHIADFYNENRLIQITRILGLVVVINAFGSIQGKYLYKNFHYKPLAKIQFITVVFASTMGLIFAYLGFGVWAIVLRSIIWALTLNLGWWIVSNWKPSLIFSRNSFRELGSYGSNILLTHIFSVLINNVSSVIIGKFFSAESLGFFSRAKAFYDLPDKNIRTVSMSVFFNSLSYIQDDHKKLISSYQKILSLYAYIFYPLYILLAILSKPMIIVLLGEKWSGAILPLQMMCLLALAIPFETVNENIIFLIGRSKFIFYLTIIKKVIFIIFVFIFFNMGVEGIILSMIIETYVGIIIAYFFASRFLYYPLIDQCKAVSNSLIISLLNIPIALLFKFYIDSFFVQLLVLPLIVSAIYLYIGYIMHLPEFYEIKYFLINTTRKILNKLMNKI